MAVVTITKHDRSQNNKDRVYFNNHHDWKDAHYVKQGLYMPPIGMVVEADCSSQEFRPGKPTYFLNSWKEVKNGAQAPSGGGNANQTAAQPPSRGNGQSVPYPPPAAPQAGWDIQSGDLSRYASNIVASAITAGLIKEPEDIYRWSKAAYKSGEGLRRGEFIPDQFDGQDPAERQGRDPDDFDDDKLPF